MKKILRYEHKYIMTLVGWHSLRDQISHLLVKDENTDERASYQVDTIYFDNESDYYYDRKEAALGTRHLVRLRTYQQRFDKVRFEIKGKVGEGVYKWSIWLTQEEHQKILEGRPDLLLNKGVIGQQLYMNLVVHHAKPQYLVRYQREVYVIPSLSVRISCDSFVEAQRTDQLSCLSTLPILPKDQVILEIKGARHLPPYLERLIASAHPMRVMISKFERAVQHLTTR